MTLRAALLIVGLGLGIAGSLAVGQPGAKSELKAPPVVTPGKGPSVSGETAMSPPSDAIVLVGETMGTWTKGRGKPATWKVDGGVMTCVPGQGNVTSAETFGDAQIHVEFKTPTGETGTGQDRGNSGVYIHGRYEVQVLDSYKSETYPDGQCGAVYKQHVPLVNVCRPQGDWQTYDIVFHAAKFGADGKKTANARVTVLQNGVLIQDNVEISGPTGSADGSDEMKEGPLMLQEHGHAVAYRNVWVRKI